MSFTGFPDGTTSIGGPVIAGAGSVSIPNFCAKVLFVDSSTGAPSGDGTDPSAPLSTIAAALARFQSAQAGGTIYVFPGTYDENLTITVDYVAIIGCVFAGYARPDVAPAAGAAITVAAQGFYTRHMRFVSEDTDSVIQNGNGFVYDDCVFDGTAGQAATEANLRLVPHATDDSFTASEGIIANSYFRGSTSGAGIIIQHGLATGSGVGPSDVQIVNNRFTANAVDMLSAVNSTGGGTGIFTNFTISGNQFLTASAAYVYINFAAGAAGDLTANNALISGNWFNDDALISAQVVLTGQAKTCFVGNFDAAGVVNGAAFNN